MNLPSSFHPIVFDAKSFDEEIPPGFNSVMIPLEADQKASLDWNQALDRARELVAKGYFLFWELRRPSGTAHHQLYFHLSQCAGPQRDPSRAAPHYGCAWSAALPGSVSVAQWEGQRRRHRPVHLWEPAAHQRRLLSDQNRPPLLIQRQFFCPLHTG